MIPLQTSGGSELTQASASVLPIILLAFGGILVLLFALWVIQRYYFEPKKKRKKPSPTKKAQTWATKEKKEWGKAYDEFNRRIKG